ANIKLGLVAINILGASGRAILRSLIAGEHDVAVLAELAKGVLRHKHARLVDALSGRFTDHHAAVLGELLAPIEYVEAAIAQLSACIAETLQPHAEQVERWQQIPGINREVAKMLLAEIELDMSRFPSAAHLAPRAGVCPEYHESASNGKTGRTRQGNSCM